MRGSTYVGLRIRQILGESMKPKLEIFNKSDFQNHNTNGYSSSLCADIANAKLNEYLETLPIVYGNVSGDKLKDWNSEWLMLNPKTKASTHTAYLIHITPIEKVCEKHENSPYHQDMFFGVSQCRHCGVKLKATWSECE